MTTAAKKAPAAKASKTASSKKAPAKTSPAKKVVSEVEQAIEYQIGIRELRQDASRVIALVEQGASITITKHGKPVATINPPKKSKWDILVERDAITPAKKKIDVRTWKPTGKYDGPDLTAIFLKERAEARH